MATAKGANFNLGTEVVLKGCTCSAEAVTDSKFINGWMYRTTKNFGRNPLHWFRESLLEEF